MAVGHLNFLKRDKRNRNRTSRQPPGLVEVSLVLILLAEHAWKRAYPAAYPVSATTDARPDRLTVGRRSALPSHSVRSSLEGAGNMAISYLDLEN